MLQALEKDNEGNGDGRVGQKRQSKNGPVTRHLQSEEAGKHTMSHGFNGEKVGAVGHVGNSSANSMLGRWQQLPKRTRIL